MSSSSEVGRRPQFGSPRVFGVVSRSGDWAGVTTPLLPNGQLAWIRLDPNRLRAGWTKTSIVVDLSERRAALLQAGDPVRSFPVTVGAPGIGDADRPLRRHRHLPRRPQLRPTAAAPWRSAPRSPHLPSGWLGGQRIAIHGTSGPLGVAASHGCVRAADADVSELVEHVPLGAPVFIRA